MPAAHRPIVIIVRDGWGANPHPEWNHANAVHLARKPVDDRLMATYPHVLIKTSGPDVGLPAGVSGNSEVGHQNIGAGRIVEQEIMRITGRIADGTFFSNQVLVGAFENAAKTGGNVHIMGLCSDGRVHSDLDHLYGLMELSRRLSFPGNRVFIHAFTDGRDSSPTRGVEYIREVDAKAAEYGINPVATVIGRYYAMDRDNRWDRIAKAYRLLVHGEGQKFPSAAAAIQEYYDHPTDSEQRGDEFVTPRVIVRDGTALTSPRRVTGDPTLSRGGRALTPTLSQGERGEMPPGIRDGDSVIFFNYRGDRPRQLTKAFVYDEFPYRQGEVVHGFERGSKLDLHYVTMTAYEEGLPVRVAFPKPPKIKDILGSYVADRGLRQFRCAETEKYAHVTFFFNDYRDQPFPGEERTIVPSTREVSTYDQKPEMSAMEVTNIVVERIREFDDELIVMNYANGDMVGHTGNLTAAIKAIETVDACVGRVVEATLAKGGGLIITADHGNCEQMIDPATGGPHTSHTPYEVELIVVDERFKTRRLRARGRLADLAPTALEMMGLPKPEAMSGESLIEAVPRV